MNNGVPASTPSDAELFQAGVVALVERFAGGSATPTDATRHYLQRIERHDAVLHAFVDLDAQGALAAAEASAARWANGRPLSPLDGVPIGLKANIAVRGWPWTGGLAARRHLLADDDAACVAGLRAAGAVLLGSLNMDEAALGATGDNPWYGRTLNPHGAGRSPGGSSAGAAAAVAAGLCAAALGTDTMGSVRIPAACCGVVGLSPRCGTIDRAGVLPLSWSFDNVGVVARSVADVEAVLVAVGGRGRSPDAQVVVPAGATGVARGSGGAGGTEAAPGAAFDADLAVLTVADNIPLAPAVRRAFEAGQDAARAAGLRLRPLPLDSIDLRRIGKALLLVVEVEAGVDHEALLREQPDSISAPLRALLEWGARQSAARLASALRELHDGRAAILAQLAAVGPSAGLLTPVVPRASFGFDEPQPQIAVFTAIGSIAGLAGLCLPMALPGDDAPGAVQILAADNGTALALARRIAARLPAVGVPGRFGVLATAQPVAGLSVAGAVR